LADLDVLYPNLLTREQTLTLLSKYSISRISALIVTDAGVEVGVDHYPYFYIFARRFGPTASRYAYQIVSVLERFAGASGEIVKVEDVSGKFDYVYWAKCRRVDADHVVCKWKKYKAYVWRVLTREPYHVPIVKGRMEAIVERARDGIGELLAAVEKDFEGCVEAFGKHVCTLADIYNAISKAAQVGVSDLAYAVGFAGFNIKYTVRFSWDRNVRFFGVQPLYTGKLDENIRFDIKVTVVDIETLGERAAREALVEKGRSVEGGGDGGRERIFVGVMEHVIGEEPREDNCTYFILPEESDEFLKFLKRRRAILGHNIVGYDLRRIALVLGRLLYETEGSRFESQRAAVEKVYKLLQQRLVLDNALILESHSSAFQLGAVRSLEDVARALAREAGIPRERIRLKARVGGRVGRLGLSELKRYNFNDLWLTAKIGNVLVPFIIAVSGLLQIPPSVVQTSFAGVLGESYMFRLFESHGILLGYMRVERVIEAPKVFIEPMLSDKSVDDIAELLKDRGFSFEALREIVWGERR